MRSKVFSTHTEEEIYGTVNSSGIEMGGNKVRKRVRTELGMGSYRKRNGGG